MSVPANQNNINTTTLSRLEQGQRKRYIEFYVNEYSETYDKNISPIENYKNFKHPYLKELEKEDVPFLLACMMEGYETDNQQQAEKPQTDDVLVNVQEDANQASINNNTVLADDGNKGSSST